MQKNADWFSKKDNIKLLAVVLLSIVLIVVLNMRTPGGKDTEKSATSPETYNTAPETQVTVREKYVKQGPGDLKPMEASILKALPSLKRDIFAFRISKNSPKRESGQKDTGLKLNATITDNMQPLAIIGSEVLGIGDFIKGFKVIEIRNHEAVLSGDGNHYTLRMIDE